MPAVMARRTRRSRSGVARTHDGITLSVVDEGPGLPPGDMDRLFDTFTRLEGSDRAKHGTGLGLAIVKGFAEAMGLTVSADNEADPRGACFTLHIPDTRIIIDLPDESLP